MKESTIEQINKLKKLFLYVFFLIIYFICEEQLGSSLVVFASNHVDRKTAYGYLPTATLITFNPLTILVTGPLLSKLMQKIPLDGMKKIMISFFLLGVAFCTLWLGCLTADSSQEIHLSLALLSIILIALGEIFIGPTVYAYASEVSNQKLQGLIMGIVTLGFALSNLLSGFLSQWMAVAEESSSFDTFLNSFRIIGLALLGFTLIVLLLNNRNKVFIT
jgi:dipeptide/tripeptide permease